MKSRKTGRKKVNKHGNSEMAGKMREIREKKTEEMKNG